LGEWVYEHFDRIPIEGDSFIYNGLVITVKEMSHNRIVMLNVKLFSETDSEGGSDK